ncbi:MAG: hypothetical protein R3D51_07005 [Hyphomicrobiaceae bacterium]
MERLATLAAFETSLVSDFVAGRLDRPTSLEMAIAARGNDELSEAIARASHVRKRVHTRLAQPYRRTSLD